MSSALRSSAAFALPTALPAPLPQQQCFLLRSGLRPSSLQRLLPRSLRKEHAAAHCNAQAPEIFDLFFEGMKQLLSAECPCVCCQL